MSQFDFPRINFHGSVLLDVATANNGRFHPLQVYDQELASPIIPPIVNIAEGLVDQVKAAGYMIEDGNFVKITSVDSVETFDKWAQDILGKSDLDKDYHKLYGIVPLFGTKEKLDAGWIQPGYWNYFGDMSVFAQDVRVTGIQIPETKGQVKTYTPDNSSGCPDGIAPLLGSSFSFHESFYTKGTKTSAMFCDVDSIGQTCTQIFFGKAGVYNSNPSQPKTFFSGKPCKSTFNWLGISKVINWYAGLLMPMSGCAYFYTTIDLSEGECDPSLQQVLDQYAGHPVTKLSVKILVHQVYEVHNPDYSKMPKNPLGNNQTDVPKNPAYAAISGSITPFMEGDMTTNTISRILKNPVSANPASDTSNMEIPKTKAGNEISIIPNLQLAPSFLKINSNQNLISLDLIGTISEYGLELGSYSNYGGDTSIPPFGKFENFDFGTLNLIFYPDDGSSPINIGTIDHGNDYQMATFLARGGVMDFPLPAGVNFSNGTFQLLRGDAVLMVEDDYLIISDQQGSYAEQNQPIGFGYKIDGPSRGQVYLRVFKRGEPVSQNSPVAGQYQYEGVGGIVSTPVHFFDGMNFSYPTDISGCRQYVFAITPNQQIPTDPNQGMYFAANGYSITTRVLDAYDHLDPYLSGKVPITWDVIKNEVLGNYETVLPIMYSVLPFDEKTWTEPSILRYLLNVIDDSYWGEPYYMPVTRELSVKQRKLLQKWATDILNSPS